MKTSTITILALTLFTVLGTTFIILVSPMKHTNNTIALGTDWKDVSYMNKKDCSIMEESIDGNDVGVTYDCKSALYVTSNGVVLAKAIQKANGLFL